MLAAGAREAQTTHGTRAPGSDRRGAIDSADGGDRVATIRRAYRLKDRGTRLREAGMLSLDEVADRLGVNTWVIKSRRLRGAAPDQEQDGRKCFRASGQLGETVCHEAIADDEAQGNGSPAGDSTVQGRPDLAKASRLRARGDNAATSAHDWIYRPASREDAMSRGQSPFWAPRTTWKID